MPFVQAEHSKLLDHYFNNAALTAPSIHVGLSTTTPTATGTNVTEPVGDGYARQATTNADWASATDGNPSNLDNATAIEFPEATGSWGTVTHFVLFDALSEGNVLAWGALDDSKAIGSGDTASFAIGDLNVDLGSPSDFV